ncbi:MAG: hypothetical protein SFX72_04805, partial [Isosphaeraceae bacterium]|nr:hypothetical protein [Isosphaeraceae bacterium]
MASISPSKPSPTASNGKLLDYEQYIDHQIQRTRDRIKMTDVAGASILLVTVALGVLFLEIFLDHRFGLPVLVRQAILGLGLIAATIFAAVRIVRPLLLSVNHFYAAKTIETADPAFKNSLINYVDLRKRRGELPKSFLRAIEARAVGELTKVDVDAVVDQNRLMRTFYGLAAIVVVFCIYAVATPKSIVDSARRAFLADLERPTNTRLLNITPGEDPKLSRVVAGANVAFSVEAVGSRPEKVVLHYSIDGGRFFAEQELAPGKVDFEPWRTTLRNVQRDLEYYLTANDAESRRHFVEVLPAPMVTAVSLDLDFPDYTKVPDRKAVESGHVDAVEGTLVTVRADTNQPPASGILDLGKVGQFPMHRVEGAEKRLEGQFRVTADGSYTVKFTTADGQKNPDPVVYEIRVRKDNPPTVKFLRPAAVVKIPANAKVAIVAEATDDFGVRDALLNVRLGNENLISDNLLQGKPPVDRLVESYDLDLAKLRLRPGDRLTYWLTVRDVKDPLPNRVESSRHEIEVVDPLAPEQLARHEENEDREKQAQENAAQPQRDPEQPPAENQERPEEPAANEEPNPPNENDPADRPMTGDEAPKAERPDDPQDRPGAQPGDDPNAEPRNPPDNAEPELSPEDRRKLENLQRALGNDANQPKPNGTESEQTSRGGKPGDDRATPSEPSSSPPNSPQPRNDPSQPQPRQTPGEQPNQDVSRPQGDRSTEPAPKQDTEASQQPMPRQAAGEQGQPQPGQKPGEQGQPQPGQKPGDQRQPQPGQKPGEQGQPQPGQKPGEQGQPQPGQKPGEQGQPQPGQKPGEQGQPMPGQKPGEQGQPMPGQKPGEQGQPQPGQKPGEQGQPQPGQKPGEQGQPQPGQKPGEQGQPMPGQKPGEQGQPQPGQKPGEQGHPMPGQKPGEQGQPMPGQKPGEQGQPQPGQKPGEQGQPQPGQKPGEQGQPQPGQKPGEQAQPMPGDKPGERGQPQPGQKPGEQAQPQPGQKPGEQGQPMPGDKPGEQAQPQPGQKPGEQGQPQPGQKPGEQAQPMPGDQPGEQGQPQPGEKPGVRGPPRPG